MRTRDKRRKKRGEKRSTRELLIVEAERLVAAKGVDGLRLSDMVDSVGIQRPSLYAHFSGRSDVLTQIITRAITGLAGDFEINDELDPLENIREGVRILVRRLIAHPAHVRILLLDFSSPIGLPEFTEKFGPPGDVEERGELRPMIDRLSHMLNEGENAGTLRRLGPLDFYHTILTVVLGRISLDQRGIALKEKTEKSSITTLEQTLDDLCVRLLKS